MEGKRWRVICGERISCGRGEARRVGRRDWRMRRAKREEAVSVKSAWWRGGGDVLLPSFSVRSSGVGVLSGLLPLSAPERRGLELVNHISGKTSRSGRTWASERHGEKKVGRRERGWIKGRGVDGEVLRLWRFKRRRLDGVSFLMCLLVMDNLVDT